MLARASVGRARPPGGAYLATEQSWKQPACDVMGEESAVAAIGSDWEVMVVSELLGRRVLLAIDGSEGTEVAARAAAEVAEGTGSALHVVYVEPLPDFVKNGDGAPGYDRELFEKIEEGARETLRKLVWRVRAGGGTVTEAHLRMGAVAEEIADLADELEVGLIVVGSRRLGRMRRVLAGSVSESVLRRARCPVMVVRAKDTPPGQRGGRPRARRVLSQDLGKASRALARRRTESREDGV